jgi:glycosyltransferase involved in cell wall biosynthesis
MEAMAYAKPVIATDVGGNSKLVKRNENGWLVDYDNHQQLAEQIHELYNDIEKIIKFGMSAREYVIENFSLKFVVNKYDKIYQK